MPLSGTSSLVLHSVSVFVVLAVCLGSSPGVRPFIPLYPTRSMSAAISLPSILLLRLTPCLSAVSVVVLILVLVPSSGVCCVPLKPNLHRLVAILVVLGYLASASVVVTTLFIYCSYSLEPVGYDRYRNEKGINKSSKIDMRKQARKPDKGNNPPGRCLPQFTVLSYTKLGRKLW